MTDFNIEDFQTFDIQKRRQELANPPVSQAVLDARAKTAQMANDYNKMNQFVALATGRRAGSPMKIPSYSDGPTASQSTAANEATLTEFMRSLEKMQEQLGRPIEESEIPAIAKAFNIGPKGLAQIKAYFPYVGITSAEKRARSGEERAIASAERAVSAEERAARGEERAEIKFTQEQEKKSAKQKEEERYDLLVREASRKLRGVQDGEGFTTEDGSQITPLDPGQTFAAQQEIFNRGMKQAEMMGLDPDEFAKRFNNLIIKAPTTKQVVDAQTGKLVFRSDREIANEQDRYIPIQTGSGKLTVQAQNAAIVAFGELGMTYPEGLKLVRLMEDLTPLVAMEQYPEKAPFIMKILTNMQTKKDLIDVLMGRAFKGSAGNSELKFE